MDDSYISGGPGGVSFVGHDAVHLFRAVTLKHAILMLAKGIVPTRGLTSKRALVMAGEYTGMRYKRGQHEEAVRDLDIWIATMRAALPVVERA